MTNSAVTVFVCVSCRQAVSDGEGFTLPGRELVDALRDRLAEASNVTVTPVECLAVCKRPSTIALVGDGKWTYLIGDIVTDTHLEQVAESALAFGRSENGIIPWKERPEVFRKGVVARIPPLGFSHKEQDPS